MLTDSFLLLTYAAMIGIGIAIGRNIEKRKAEKRIGYVREASFEHGRRIERQLWDIPAQ